MRIGFFGGAFDPFHTEHKNIIICAKNELNLDKIVVYPSCLPPHKQCGVDFDSRKTLVKIALNDLPYVEISDVEKLTNRESNPSYVILPMLNKGYNAEENYFIIGGDSALNFDKWLKPEIVAKVMKIAVVARENKEEVHEYCKKIELKYGADVTVLSYVGKQVSGSIIKAKIELGICPEEIDKAVYDEIKRQNLYQNYAKIITKLKNELTERTYNHCVRTVLYALKLNVKLGLPYEQVFLAGLLHDCAKNEKNELKNVPSAVVHQFVGAEKAKIEYGIADENILSAIKYHTTGKGDMTTLEKLTFCADMLEQNRDFDGVKELRAVIEKDFEKGFCECVKASYQHLKRSGNPIYYLTEECLAYIIKKKD